MSYLNIGQAQQIDARDDDLPSVNGSDPRVSLLTDGIVPVLSISENRDWARQLYTTVNIPDQDLAVAIDLSDFVQQIDIEVVLFNCPEWNIGTDRIRISGGASDDERRDILLGEAINLPTSCDSLVHVCLPAVSTILAPVVVLDFSNIGPDSYIHIGELIFNSGSCPANLVTPNQSKCVCYH